jgi:hypothetical protein
MNSLASSLTGGPNSSIAGGEAGTLFPPVTDAAKNAAEDAATEVALLRVLNRHQQPIPGLWVQNGIYYGEIHVPGETTTMKVALHGAINLNQAVRALRIFHPALETADLGFVPEATLMPGGAGSLEELGS